jgi:hypothetical protein
MVNNLSLFTASVRFLIGTIPTSSAGRRPCFCIKAHAAHKSEEQI